jgi:ribonuclease-3
MTERASRLLEQLGVDIDPELLALALTHRSWAYEQGGVPHNERLEFLGDSILGQAITIELYRRFPDAPEGDLAKRRAGVVSTVALAEGGAAKASILADTMEAVFGAAYLSAGHTASAQLVLRLVAPLLDDPDRTGAALDPKTALQEVAAAQHRGAPVYEIEAAGPDHARTFTATVLIDDEPVATGTGTSKKVAEMGAALTAYDALVATVAAERPLR